MGTSEDVELEKVESVGGSPLHQLVEANNIDALQLITNSGPFVNTKNDLNQTPLHLGIELGHVECALLLIDVGAQVNTIDKDGWTPLISASKLGNVELAKSLIRNGALQRDADQTELTEMGGWSAVTWASYKGHDEVLNLLLENDGDPSTIASFGMAPLLWAAGRGHTECVQILINNGADVQKSDKFGSTALYWACRKGYIDACRLLLHANIDVNAVGANGQNSLIVASKYGFGDIIDLLLTNGSNVNQTDKDGNSALAYAAASGELHITEKLLIAGAYLNHTNHKGDSALILATRQGHQGIVKVLLSRSAHVDHAGNGNKTALYWAAENSKLDIVKELLMHDSDTEIMTDEHETALLRAAKNTNWQIVDCLLRKGAKVSARDARGDSSLHISLRSKNRKITEMLLRNPRDSRLLYKLNMDGETPYQIDLANKKSILTQIFGTKSLSDPMADGGDPTQYDLYSAALADILSEPTLSPPITVGLFAQWGSGKSFLLRKLEDIMDSFVGETNLESFVFGWIWIVPIILVVIWISLVIGLCVPPDKITDEKDNTDDDESSRYQLATTISVSVASIIIFVYFAFLIFIQRTEQRFGIVKKMSNSLVEAERSLRLLLCMLFFHGYRYDPRTSKDKPVRFMFTDYSRLSSVGGETSLAEMVGALTKTAERKYGVLATRTYRAMKPRNDRTSHRKVCCFPLWLIAIFTVIDLVVLSICGATRFHYSHPQPTEPGSGSSSSDDPLDLVSLDNALWAFGVIGIIFLITLLISYWNVLFHLAISPHRRLIKSAQAVSSGSSFESFIMTLKKEVDHLSGMVNAFDAFGTHQTRLVVVVNGLDSCEQDKILDVLETVTVLFTKSPYIVILAIDDNIIVKAVDRNLNQRAQLEINGRDYLKNMIHLPFYMQDQSIELLKRNAKEKQLGGRLSHDRMSALSQIPAREKSIRIKEEPTIVESLTVSGSNLSTSSSPRITDRPSSPMGNNDEKLLRRRKRNRIPENETKRSSLFLPMHSPELDRDSTRVSRAGGTSNAFDLTKMLATEDWFSSISPQIMKRILNVVSLTGRLLRANRFTFSWDRLATWINMTEMWPYRTSWIVLYIEENEDLENKTQLKTIYRKIYPLMPQSTQQEPLLEIDNADSRQLEVFLSAREPALTVKDVIDFLSCTVNLDPKLREWIADVQVVKSTTAHYPMHDTSGGWGMGPQITQMQSPMQPTIQTVNSPASSMNTSSVPAASGSVPHAAVHSPHMPMNIYPSAMQGTTPIRTSLLFHGLTVDGAHHKGHSIASPNSRPTVTIQDLKQFENFETLTSEKISEWTTRVPGMTTNGALKAAKYFIEQNISGFVLSQLVQNLDFIRSEIGLSLGDFILLKNAICAELIREQVSSEIADSSVRGTGSIIGSDDGIRLDPPGQSALMNRRLTPVEKG